MIKRGPPGRYPVGYPNYQPGYPRTRTTNNFPGNPNNPQPNNQDKKKNIDKTKILAIISIAVILAIIIAFIVIGIKAKNKPKLKENLEDLDNFNADLKISNVVLLNESNLAVEVQELDEQENLKSVIFVFYENEKEIMRRTIPFIELKEKDFNLSFRLRNTSKISEVSIIPVFIDKDGKNVEGEIEDEFVVERKNEVGKLPENPLENLSENRVVECNKSSQCDDSNICTANKCENGKCVYIAIPGCFPCNDDSQCEDHNPNTENVCLQGRCVYNLREIVNNSIKCSVNSDCNDDIPCTRDVCANEKCVYFTIDKCIHNDGCCPPGNICVSINDNDCAPVCGNNIIEGDEKCDGSDLDGKTCAELLGAGYTGILKCNSDCDYDTSGCVAPCSDTCESLGYECGTQKICGKNVVCGNYNGGCQAGYSCQSNGKCTKNPCVPETCASLGRNCGTVSDGCGGTLTCGNYNGGCQTGYTCQTDRGFCVQNPCVPATCASLGRNCGTVSDGCGGTLTCGNYNGGCQTGYTCQTDRGLCVASTPSYYCGDGACNNDETCSSCPADCGQCPPTNYLRTFYVSSSSGNDANSGTSPSSPWKTLSKVNSQTFRAGDAILFKRGDSWYGSLTVSNSGSSSAPITYGAYGTGNKPIISGFKTISGWTSSGGGTYYQGVSTESSPLIVTVNGKNTPKGRWPNTGWILFDSYSGYTSITDKELNGKNFVNGEVVIRVAKWITYRAKITSHSGSTINFPWELGGDYSLKSGQGFFIQNDVDTFDIVGDWAYVNGNLYMYFGSNSPSNYNVRVSTLDSFAKLNRREYITFDNLYLEGYNTHGIEVRNSRHITMTNCEFQNMGGSGIYGPWDGDSSYMKVENCKFIENNNCGIKVMGNHENAIIRYNTFKNIGMIDGLAGIRDGSAIGITSDSKKTLISNNNIEYAGYNGISFKGESSKVINNFINHFCQKKDDCGGIYTYEDSGTGKQILDNVVMNSLNHNEGIDESSDDFHAHGIYIDGSDNVQIHRNTVANNEGAGIFLNTQALGIDLQNNLAFGNVRGIQIISNWRGMGEITGLIMRNNIFVAKESTHHTLYYTTGSGNEGVKKLGSVNYNYYARPIDDTKTFRNQIYLWNGPTTYRTLAEWQSYSGLDSNSKKSPKSISSTSDLRFEYNPTSSSKTINLDRNYIDIKGERYSGSLVLKPYSSIVLIKD